MRSLYACANDVPPDMHRKVNLLHVKEKKIVELEAQIEVLRNDCDSIRLEMSRYLVLEDVASSTGPLYTKTGAPINRCPDEILSNIFSLYLIDHHISIRRLLLVCKRWYQLVINSQRMWARIQVLDIRPFIKWSDKEPVAKPYIAACMRRSNGLPMDVELNLRELNLPARRYLGRLTEHSSHESIRNALWEKITRTDEYDKNTLGEYVEYGLRDLMRSCRCLNSHSDGAFDNVSNGSHCDGYNHRWSTLFIRLPDNVAVIDHIWKRIGKATPRLSVIKVQQYFDNWIKGSDIPVPDFSAVESLTLRVGRSIHDFKVSPALLRHLDIQFYPDLAVLEELSAFEHLETLCLYGIRYPSHPVSKFTIRLPKLVELECSGYYEALTYLDFDLPHLTKLSMSSHLTHYPIPGISPRYLKWIDPFVGYSPFMVALYSKEPFPLTSILSAYPAVQVFSIPARFKQEVIAMLSKCEVPHTHITWLTDDEMGDVQRLDTSEMALASANVDSTSNFATTSQ